MQTYQRTGDPERNDLCLVDRLKLWLSWSFIVAAYACFAYDAATAHPPIDWWSYASEVGLFSVVAYGVKHVFAWLVPRYCHS